uniref:Uncharacterized protein n=1 Tax=Zea mays TaxID=4577 RepID=C4J3B7_MAIZE|nr:unknown [Zea mays]
MYDPTGLARPPKLCSVEKRLSPNSSETMANTSGHCAPKQNPTTTDAAYSDRGAPSAISACPAHASSSTPVSSSGRGTRCRASAASDTYPAATRPA